MTTAANTCVLISSCDRYYDLWDPFFHFFEKYWPACPYPVYLATNQKAYVRKNVQVVHSGLNSTWSEEMLAVLKQLPYPYIIYLQDDYFILKPVDNRMLDRLLEKTKRYHAACLRLFPSPGPDAFFNDAELGLVSAGAPYRTSLQGAIWEKQAFTRLLDTKENQWQFEMNGGARSANDLILSLKSQQGNFRHHVYPISYYYLTAVIRGKWHRQAAAICKKEGVTLDTAYRPVESYGAWMYRRIYPALPLLLKKIADRFFNTSAHPKKQHP